MPAPALLDSQQQLQQNNYGFNVEDILNMDLFGGTSSNSNFVSNMATSSAPTLPSAPASSSSRSSSRSPSDSFSQLPPTPPQPVASGSLDFTSFFNLPAIDEESMFTFNFDGGNDSEFFKSATNSMAGPSTGSPYDLFGGTFAGDLSANAASGASTTAGVGSSTAQPSTQAINPQLVGTPDTSSRDADSDDEKEKDDDEDEEDGLSILIPIKVGGKGKARKGTLQSGGVQKKPIGPQSIFGSLADKGSIADKFKDNDDDWRPSPEEYQKMSSKEKRQLRNKISARNFRVRRKEYIATLEGDIAERDRLIEAIRSELGNTKSENNALRQEVAVLKKAILEGRASPMLPPPAPLSPLSPLTSFSPLPQSSSTNNNIVRPNTQKDLPTSPRLAAIRGSGAFWGGQANSFGGIGGGITPVHTAIIPQTGFGGSSKGGVSSGSDKSNENMNPSLNQVPTPITVAANKVFTAGHGANQQPTTEQQQEQQQQQNLLMGHVLSQLQRTHGFDSFSDVNPFTLKTLDAYRMQLWSRVAMQAQQQRARAGQQPISYPSPSSSNTSPSSSPSPAPGSPSLYGLANGLRPLHFTSPPSAPSSPAPGKLPLSSLLSGKGLLHNHNYHYPHGLPSPPSSPRMDATEKKPAQMQREQVQQHATHALLANLASQTILQKMGQAFWDALSGSSRDASGQKTWDSEKVRKVMEGTAVLRVVDVEPKKASTSADALEESMRSLSLSSSSSSALSSTSKDEKKSLFARLTCSTCQKSNSSSSQ